MTVTMRAADLGARLALGDRLSVRNIAAEYDMSRQGAWLLINKIAVVLPITQDVFGAWCWINPDDMFQPGNDKYDDLTERFDL